MNWVIKIFKGLNISNKYKLKKINDKLHLSCDPKEPPFTIISLFGVKQKIKDLGSNGYNTTFQDVECNFPLDGFLYFLSSNYNYHKFEIYNLNGVVITNIHPYDNLFHELPEFAIKHNFTYIKHNNMLEVENIEGIELNDSIFYTEFFIELSKLERLL